jgi:hypothetical protein
MVASSYEEVYEILSKMEALVFPIDLSCAQLCFLKEIRWTGDKSTQNHDCKCVPERLVHNLNSRKDIAYV